MLAMLLLVSFLLLAAVLAPRFGVDTRDGRDWTPAGEFDRSGRSAD